MAAEIITQEGGPSAEEKHSRVLSELAVHLKDVLEQRDRATLSQWKDEISGLATPDRSKLEEVTPKGDYAPGEVRVSRRQPTDRIYEHHWRKYPEMREWRTPDLDHWGAMWLRSLCGRDTGGMKHAADMANRYIRANEVLEGAIDASDPTAVLGGSGGHLLPQNLAQVVMISRDAAAVLPRLVQNYTMTSGTLRIPTAAGVTTAMVSESSTQANLAITFTSEMLKAQKLQAIFQVSDEMLADAAFNVVSILAERSGMDMGEREDIQICTSNGTAPNITEAIAGGNVDEASSTILQYVDLVSLFFALGKPYRRNAVWLGSSATLTLVSQLVDSNGRPVIGFINQMANAPVSDEPGNIIGTIYNRPVYEVPLADGVLLFGDVRGYAFARRQGILAAVSEGPGFTAGLQTVKFYERIDGRIIDDQAMKQMAGLATVA